MGAETTDDELRPAVSVVMPTFNRQKSLPRAIGSVLAQTFPDFELIVVDDASTDGTLGTLAAICDPRLRALRMSRNSGAAAARNRGIANARGRWVAFLDSDDTWAPDKLETQVAFMRSADYKVRMSCTAYRYVTAGEVIAVRSPGPIITREQFTFGCTCSPGSTLMAERALFAEVGGFNEQMRRLEDWEWLVRSTALSDIAVLPEVLSTIEARTSGGSLYPKVKGAIPQLRRALAAGRPNAETRRLIEAILAFELAAVAYLDNRMHLAILELMRAMFSSPKFVRNALTRVTQRVHSDAMRALGAINAPILVHPPVSAAAHARHLRDDWRA